jgi:2-octaprenylphenol hydroxylase
MSICNVSFRSENFDIVIIGGGIVGLTFANLCAQQLPDMKLALIEQQAPVVVDANNPSYASNAGKKQNLRTVALNPASVKLFTELGVWQQVLQQDGAAAHYKKMQVFAVDAVGVSCGRLDFAAPKVAGWQNAAAQFPLGFIVENNALVAALWQQANSCSNLQIFMAQVGEIKFAASGEGGRASVAVLPMVSNSKSEQTADPQSAPVTITANLVIGADGQNSKVRSQANIDVTTLDYGQSALICNVTTQLPHQNTATQFFLADGSILAFLPLAAPNLSSIVWSMPTLAAQQYAADTMQDAMQGTMRLQASFNSIAIVSEIFGHIEVSSQTATFPLKMLRAREVCRARIALLGDAAHVVHPLAGQGVNLGIADVAELVAVLQQDYDAAATKNAKSSQFDCGKLRLLRQYARARATNVLLMQNFMTGLQKLFAANNKPAQWCRTTGMNLLNKFPGLKSKIVNYAAGGV